MGGNRRCVVATTFGKSSLRSNILIGFDVRVASRRIAMCPTLATAEIEYVRKKIASSKHALSFALKRLTYM